MKAVIIDNEASARDVLTLLLKEYAPDVHILADAGTYDAGVDLLRTTTPDIIFLDIDLGSHSGFDVLDTLGTKASDMSVIFVTTYSEHALKAFKYAAVDYLLKPIVPEELVKSVEKVISKMPLFSINQLQKLKEELFKVHLQNNTRNNIIVKGYNGTLLIPAADILYCKGEGSYTKIVKKDGSTITASRPLYRFEEQFSDLPHFVRVHKSYIANMNEVKFISKKEVSNICFSNDICIPITNHKEIWDLLH